MNGEGESDSGSDAVDVGSATDAVGSVVVVATSSAAVTSASSGSPSPFMERGPGGEVFFAAGFFAGAAFAAGFFAVAAFFFAGAAAGFGVSPPKGSLPRTLRAIGLNRSFGLY
jgi:hypothetical protein